MIAAHHSICDSAGIPCIDTWISGNEGNGGGYIIPFGAHQGYRFELNLSILSENFNSDGAAGILSCVENNTWRIFSIKDWDNKVPACIFSDLDSTDQGRRTALDITQFLDKPFVLSVVNGMPRIFCGDNEAQIYPTYSISRSESYPNSVKLFQASARPVGRRFFGLKVYDSQGSIIHDYIPCAKNGEAIVVDGITKIEYHTLVPEEYRFVILKGDRA